MDVWIVSILAVLLKDILNVLVHEKALGTHFSMYLGVALLGQRVGIRSALADLILQFSRQMNCHEI